MLDWLKMLATGGRVSMTRRHLLLGLAVLALPAPAAWAKDGDSSGSDGGSDSGGDDNSGDDGDDGDDNGDDNGGGDDSGKGRGRGRGQGRGGDASHGGNSGKGGRDKSFFQISQDIRGYVNGEIVGLSRNRSGGRSVYRARVIDTTGRIRQLTLDARTGTLLNQGW